LKKILTLVIVLQAFLLSNAHALNNIKTTIVKDKSGSWTVTFEAAHPVKYLSFKSSPDNSRITRWKPSSKDFGIYSSDTNEIIKRVDEASFKKVTLELTPTYIALPKEYAPFSPYSDGSMLFHSGRFFACAEKCTNKHDEWMLELRVETEENIILNGEVRLKFVTWIDSGDGRKVYVGRHEPVSNEHFIAVIDEELPVNLRTNLVKYIPLLIKGYSQSFGLLREKPMLFASYSKTEDGTFGHQGGVLPNQVFTHWYGRNLNQHITDEDTFWFFSHEIAHFYQGAAGDVPEDGEAWVQEGVAEFMASESLKTILPNSLPYVTEKLQSARSSCISRLGSQSLYSVAKKQMFDLYYSCGLMISKAINDEVNRVDQHQNIFSVWKAFQKNTQSGLPASADTFMLSVKPFVSDEFYNVLYKAISPEHVNAEYINQL